MSIVAGPDVESRGGARLRAENLVVGYGDAAVLDGVTIEIPDGELTVIIGPNACGKSTLLKALGRVLPVQSGSVTLDGQQIGSLPPKQVAKVLAMLPQTPAAPDGLTVAELVSRGRYPHQSLLRQWSSDDDEAVTSAMRQANITDLAERNVEDLSGGQRQRAWLAMVLAQDTPLMLLDEPTTYLDIAHQIDVLNLCRTMHHSGRTVVAVLHELNLAFRYATHLVVMRSGQVIAQGDPREIVTEQLIREVYDVPCVIMQDPVTARPMVVPTEEDAR